MLQMTPAVPLSLCLVAEQRYDSRPSSDIRDDYVFITHELIKPKTCQAFATHHAARGSSASGFLEKPEISSFWGGLQGVWTWGPSPCMLSLHWHWYPEFPCSPWGSGKGSGGIPCRREERYWELKQKTFSLHESFWCPEGKCLCTDGAKLAS